ncbi:MAG: LysR family transcriptional regulator [Pseudomonadota bacterium]|nr:LysR family transcriptional regulator [Pseudomonadota bacterium]
MQIDLIETFLDLMETSSFNRTAERLGITQSTVSSRIQALETALERRLFQRSRAGTKPTPAGLRFLDHARNLRHEWNQASRAVRRVHDFDQALRIGIQHDLAASRIGEWMADFRSVLPGTHFYVELDYSNQMNADLLAGDLDLAVVFTPRHLPDLVFEPVGEVVYRMVSGEAGLLAEITPERYIFANYSPTFDRMHRRIASALVDAPQASGQDLVVAGMLAALGGSAYVLEETALAMVADQGYRFVEDAPAISQPVYAAVHLQHRHSHIHRRLHNVIRKHFAQDQPVASL